MSERVNILKNYNVDVLESSGFTNLRDLGDLVDCKNFDFTNLEYIIYELKNAEDLIMDGETRICVDIIKKLRSNFMRHIAVVKED